MDSNNKNMRKLLHFSEGLGAFAVLACCWCAGVGQAQEAANLPAAPMPSASVWQLPKDVVVERATTGVLPLSLDEAIDRGLKNNLRTKLDEQNVKLVHGEVLTVANSLLPTLTADAYSRAQEINLAAMGFKPQNIHIPGFAGSIPNIVKVNTTDAQLKLSQQLFNVPAYYLYRAAQKAQDAAEWNSKNTRGSVVLAVGTQYLRTLADGSQIENAQSLEKADELVLQQATASHDAGVGTNLDVLRARVQLQTQQQVLINAENTFAKDKIALNRLIGLPAEQELQLTDPVPYAELADLPLSDAMTLAFDRRKDLRGLESQVEVADRTRKAVKFERLPSLSFTGNYGVLGETTGLYHGVFSAEGNLKVPLFEEAQFRGEREVADAQLNGLRQQIASLRVTIEQQIRSSMLDVQSADERVKVARSNVELATEELQQTTDRFAAGVDDNLPVVQAAARLAAAQSRLVQTMYEFNQAKLTLARNTGVVETQYKTYLGR